MFVEAGMTPLQALQTATLQAAKYLGMLDTIGSVEAGKIADLVLLDGNPLDDINDTRTIAAVVVNGRLFTKSDLQQMVADAERAAVRGARARLPESCNPPECIYDGLRKPWFADLARRAGMQAGAQVGR